MIVYLNGQYIPREQAHVSVEDRGFLYGDGVYDVVRYYGGRALAMADHLNRMQGSCRQIKLSPPQDLDLGAISDELVKRNALPECMVYWQITRGVAPRRHVFPKPQPPLTVLAMAYPLKPLNASAPPEILTAITRPDLRWHRCSIKAISLLANVLEAQAAAEAGADEAILVRDSIVTEGTTRSIFIAEGKTLLTHPADDHILDSITRKIFLDLAGTAGIEVRQEKFPLDRLMKASEVIAAGTTTESGAIVKVDGRPIGSGTPGPMAQRLRKMYVEYIVKACAIDR